MAGDGVSYFAAQGSDSSEPDQTSQRATHQMLGCCPASGQLLDIIQSQLRPTEGIGHLWLVGWLKRIFFSCIRGRRRGKKGQRLRLLDYNLIGFYSKNQMKHVGGIKTLVAAYTHLLYEQPHYRSGKFAVQLRLKCLSAIETTQKGSTDRETLREPWLFRKKKKRKSLYSCRGKLELRSSRDNADHHPLQQRKWPSLLKRLSDKIQTKNWTHTLDTQPTT